MNVAWDFSRSNSLSVRLIESSSTAFIQYERNRDENENTSSFLSLPLVYSEVDQSQNMLQIVFARARNSRRVVKLKAF
jgi:hypothetical protein